MCMNQDCPSRNECWRFRAIPSYRQSYMGFKPAEGKDRCDDFWPIEGRPVASRQEPDVRHNQPSVSQESSNEA